MRNPSRHNQDNIYKDNQINQWMVELLLNGKLVQYKIDTGANVTAISEEIHDSRNWIEPL